MKKEQKLTEAEIWYNPKEFEPYLKKIGLKFPKYPKQGDVTKDGKVVGHMDNFNGFSVYSQSLLRQLQKVANKYKLGIWNPTSGVRQEQKLREVIRKIVREDFAGAYPEHQRKKFDGKRRKQSEVLGYKLTGVNDVRTEIDDATVKESVYTLPRGSNTQDLDELDADLIRAGLKDKEVTPNFTKLSVKINKTILKGSSIGVKVNKIIKKYKLKQTEGKIREHAAGGLTYKKGKTVTGTHKKSGKELVIIDKPNVRKEYEKIGYVAEGKITEKIDMNKKYPPFAIAKKMLKHPWWQKYGKGWEKKLLKRYRGRAVSAKLLDRWLPDWIEGKYIYALFEGKITEGVVREGSETPIEVARRIVQNGQHEKYKGMMLDAFTASAIVKVYDAVNDSNKKKMDKLKLPKLVNIVWKLIGRS